MSCFFDVSFGLERDLEYRRSDLGNREWGAGGGAGRARMEDAAKPRQQQARAGERRVEGGREGRRR